MKNLSFKRYLIEMPLPADWDKSQFNNSNSFAKQIKYAKERAQQIGAGSSRVAFTVPYEGRQTVIKVAKNSKGLAQNEHESQMMNDYYLKDLGLVIPMIDYDEESTTPTWIHTEFATKAKESDFIKACGGKLADLCAYALKYCGKRGFTGGDPTKIPEENEFAYTFADMVGNYDLPIGDFTRLANWGVYNGHPVIVDIGVNNEIMTSLYGHNPKQANHWR